MEECVLPVARDCWVGDPSGLCQALDPFHVEERVTLPEADSALQAEKMTLSAGHYKGSLGTTGERGQEDRRDWYRVSSPVGQGVVIWLEADPGLSYEAYIVDVCGIVQHKVEVNEGSFYCVIPCTDPDDEDLDTCGWYLRIDRRSGEGEYRLSVFIEELES